MPLQIHRLSEHVKAVSAYDPADIAASTTNGAGVDTFGFRRVSLLVNAKTGASTTVTFKVQESDDNSTWTDVTGAALAAPQAQSLANVYFVDLDPQYRKRYFRVVVTGVGGSPAGAISASWLLHQAIIEPVTQSQTPLYV